MRKSKRSDAGAARKFSGQEAFLINFVKQRWDDGDPIGKIELQTEISAREDCAEGTDFFNAYLAPGKESGWSKWIGWVLKRHDFSLRKNSIGQTVPENWRELSEACAKKIRERMAEEGVNVVVRRPLLPRRERRGLATE